MNVRAGDTVECIHHMSNRGKVLRTYRVKPTAGTSAGPLMQLTRVVFLSEMDNKEYDMLARDLRKVRE